MDLLDTMTISASGLTAQRVRLQSIASNLANARTTRTERGIEPYQRRTALFESAPIEAFGDQFDRELSTVEIIGVDTDGRPGRPVYDPGHPDSDENGYVLYPNIDVMTEMVDMMTASRTYEANLNVLETTRNLAMRALEIGR
jgi:flagellar basal-body rod protein FlgC